MANKKKKEPSVVEAAGSILPEFGKALYEFITSIGKTDEKKENDFAGDVQIKVDPDFLSEDPNMGWTKKQIKSYMDANKVKYNSGDTKKDLLQKLKWSKK